MAPRNSSLFEAADVHPVVGWCLSHLVFPAAPTNNYDPGITASSRSTPPLRKALTNSYCRSEENHMLLWKKHYAAYNRSLPTIEPAANPDAAFQNSGGVVSGRIPLWKFEPPEGGRRGMGPTPSAWSKVYFSPLAWLMPVVVVPSPQWHDASTWYIYSSLGVTRRETTNAMLNTGSALVDD